MTTIKQEFIELLLSCNALKFGSFTLKSGRISPYFFNFGAFNHGNTLAKLGKYYARTLMTMPVQYDVLFGPAYKGIPIVCATSIALATELNQDLPYCFNRKLKKNYGDGGDIVGAPLQGRVLMIDDVITAGTTILEAMTIIQQHQATLAGILIAFDRQEKGLGQQSAVQEANEKLGIPIYSIATLQDVIDYLQQTPTLKHHLTDIYAYREQYGAGYNTVKS